MTQPPKLCSAEQSLLGPMREVWKLAWPSVITMGSYTVMQFMDSLLVAQVGPTELAAQGNGAMTSWLSISFAFGLMTVINTYVAQYLGARNVTAGVSYGWAGIWIAIIYWLIFLVPVAVIIPRVFMLIGHEGSMLEWETSYARILLLGGFITLSSKALHHFFFGMHRPKIVTVSALVGNITNVVMSYCLIFGEQGMPALGLPGIPGLAPMGVMGAAIGTLIGTSLEMLIPLAIFLGPRCNRLYGTRANWRPRIEPIRRILRIGWPASVTMFNESLCWWLFMTVLIGSFGESDLVAAWIAVRYLHLSFMPALGFNVAATSLVGRYIGSNQFDLAVGRARLCVVLAVSWTVGCAVAFLLFRYEFLEFFLVKSDIEPGQMEKILQVGSRMMIATAIFLAFDGIGIVYNGALRGAGDTRWPGIVTIILSWLLLIGLGAFMVRFVHSLGSIGPWIAAASFLIVLALALMWRFESGGWKSIRLLDEDSEAMLQSFPPGPTPPDMEAVVLAQDMAERPHDEPGAGGSSSP